MATVRELVIQKEMERLNGAGKPGGVPATERTRTFALDQSQLISSIIYPVRNPVINPSRPRRGALQHEVHTVVELRAKGDGVSAPDVLLDPVIDWVIKALCGSFEPGLWSDVEYEDTEFEWAQAEYAFCIARMRLVAISSMKTNDPSVLA